MNLVSKKEFKKATSCNNFLQPATTTLILLQDRFDCERFDSWMEKSQTLAFTHQCCKTSCTFLAVARFKAALISQATGLANFTIHSAFSTYIKY